MIARITDYIKTLVLCFLHNYCGLLCLVSLEVQCTIYVWFPKLSIKLLTSFFRIYVFHGSSTTRFENKTNLEYDQRVFEFIAFLIQVKRCYLSLDLVNVCVLFNLTQLLLISVNKQQNTNNLWVIFRIIEWKGIVADMMIILCLHGGLHNISLCLYHKPVLQFVLPCLSSLHI